MALEDITAGDSIATLVTTNPVSGDNVSQGDDHIRNLKKALQFTFPNICATASGVASEFAFAHKGGTVSGNAQIKGTLTVSAATHLQSTLSVGGAAVLSGAATLNTTLSVSGATHLKATLSVGGAATFADTLSVSGATHLKGAVSVGGNAQLAGNISVAGRTDIIGALSVGGNTGLGGTLTVSGATHFKGGVSVGLGVTVTNELSVGGKVHAQSSLSVSGNINVTGDVDSGGIIKVRGLSPQMHILESISGSQSGKWRILAESDVLFFQKNTAAGGDFATGDNLFFLQGGKVNVGGNLSVSGASTFTGPVTGVDSAAFATSSLRTNTVRLWAARLGASATALWNPHGWSFSLGGTDIQVTHNLGISTMSINVTPDQLAGGALINSVTNNTFRVLVVDTGGSAIRAVTHIQVVTV